MKHPVSGFGLAAVLWLALCAWSLASAADKYRITPISAWCASAHVFDQVVKLEQAEGQQAVIDYLQAEFALGVCRRGRWAFVAEEVLRAYEDRKELVLRGTIHTGQEVFVWTDTALYPAFLAPGSDT